MFNPFLFAPFLLLNQFGLSRMITMGGDEQYFNKKDAFSEKA